MTTTDPTAPTGVPNQAEPAIGADRGTEARAPNGVQPPTWDSRQPQPADAAHPRDRDAGEAAGEPPVEPAVEPAVEAVEPAPVNPADPLAAVGAEPEPAPAAELHAAASAEAPGVESDGTPSPGSGAAESTEQPEQPAPESPLEAQATEAALPTDVPAGREVAPAEQERFDLLCRKVEAAVAALEGHASRVSALSGGTRFSTLQKTHYGFVTEYRTLRAQRPDEPTFNGLQSLLERIERLERGLMPPRKSEASGAETPPGEVQPRAPRSAGALRQAVIRGMILLAPAPLHLQLEFAPEFPLAEADPIALASRSHAVNRSALGSLRRIQWEAPDRCSLWFGEGEQRQVVAATFDEQGKVVLPPEFRQKQNPPGQGASRTPRAAAGASGVAGAGRDPAGSRPPHVELMGPPSPFARRFGPDDRQGRRRRGGGTGAFAGGSQQPTGDGAAGPSGAPERQRHGPRGAPGSPAGRPRQIGDGGGRSGQPRSEARGPGSSERPAFVGPPRPRDPNRPELVGPPRPRNLNRPNDPNGSNDSNRPKDPNRANNRQRSSEAQRPAGANSPGGGLHRDGRPGGSRPDGSRPGGNTPGAGRPDGNRPNGGRFDSARPGGPRPGGAPRPDGGTEAGRRADGRPEGSGRSGDRSGGRPRDADSARGSYSGGGGRGREDRGGRPGGQPFTGGRGGGFPANSMLADKLRAALAPSAQAAPTAPAASAPRPAAATSAGAGSAAGAAAAATEKKNPG